MLPVGFVNEVVSLVGADHVLTDASALETYGLDALKRTVGGPAELVVLPGSTAEVAGLARLCNRERVPLTPRGAGTGYSGGAVPVARGVVLSLERLNRIVEIDRPSLLAVVEPNVVTGDLQRAVEAVGLFYPPDPASLEQCVIGGNVAECAGGPRAFKYGTTKRYVLGLEAVLPSGEVIRTGGRSVKNVVGYDITQLLVGSEGTLAVVTEIILRLIPRPQARATLRAPFPTISHAVEAVGTILADGVTPAAMELIDAECLRALDGQRGTTSRPGLAGALLLVEVDGLPAAIDEEIARVTQACAAHGALDVRLAKTETERDRLWDERRGLSLALRAMAPRKINHDVVVPKERSPSSSSWSISCARRQTFRCQVLVTSVTAISTSTSWSTRLTATPCAVRRKPSGSCWRVSSRLGGRSVASTELVSPKRRFWSSSSRPRR